MALHRCAMFCKSFAEDFGRLAILLASHERYCPGLPFLLSIPSGHRDALHRAVALHDGITLVCDEDYAGPFEAVGQGWVQQQICKLSVHRTEFADAYLSVDSDAYLVAPVTPDDLFDGERMRVVYSSLFTKYQPGNDALLHYLLDREALAPAAPKRASLAGFGGRLRTFRQWVAEHDAPPVERGWWINRLFDVPDGTALQPGQILHARLLRHMESFLQLHGLDVAGLLALIPWEYNWYGAWASVSAPLQVACGVSPIVHFASAADVAHAKARGVSEATLARRFKVVQMAARHFDATRF